MAKILLVEDDVNLREIFDMRLQAEGYETATASDGEEALTVALRERPDLIIADVMMPKLSGFEMIENLRAAPEMNNTKVIMMTALGQAEDRARGESLGVLKYLVKSQVTLEDFVRVVRDVLPPGQAYSITTNQGGQNMQDDTTPQTSPAPQPDSNVPTDSGSGTQETPSSDSVSQTGQQSAAEEQNTVNQQVNDFVTNTPADPAAGQNTTSDSSLGGPSVPPTSAPGQENSPNPSGTQQNPPSGL